VTVLTVIRLAIESAVAPVTSDPDAMAVAIALTNVAFHAAKFDDGSAVTTNVPWAALVSVDPDVTLGVVPVDAVGQLTRPHVNLQSPANVGSTHEQPVVGVAQSAGEQVDVHVCELHIKDRSPVQVLTSTPAAVAHRRVCVPPPHNREH